MEGYVGIDVSKARLDVLLIRGPQQEGQQFTNTATGFGKLQGWLRCRLAVSQVAVCLEATGPYGDGVATYLHEQGYRVSVVNPARMKGYAASHMQRNQTDKLDAALIADFCRTQQPAAWTPPSPQQRQLQQLVRHLVAFAGLNPRQHLSGSSIHKRPTISRTGSVSLRAALYMSAMRFNPVLRAFAERLRTRGLAGKAVVVAVMCTLLHLGFGVLKSGQPFDPTWATVS